MRVKLIREASIKHKAGEIVEVSPTECAFLTGVGAAVLVDDEVKVAEPVSEVKEPEPVVKSTKAVKSPVKKVAKKK